MTDRPTTRHERLLADPLFGAAYKAGFEGDPRPAPPAGGDGFRAAWDGAFDAGQTQRRQAAEYQARTQPADLVADTVTGLAEEHGWETVAEAARQLTARTADHLEQVDGEWVRQSVDAPGNFIEVPEPVDGGRL